MKNIFKIAIVAFATILSLGANAQKQGKASMHKGKAKGEYRRDSLMRGEKHDGMEHRKDSVHRQNRPERPQGKPENKGQGRGKGKGRGDEMRKKPQHDSLRHQGHGRGKRQ